jgi:cytochrome c biogenesis protein CcmG/thiol:disulfide interchange protein DsbE
MRIRFLRHSRILDAIVLVGALGFLAWRAWPQVAAALGTSRTGAPAPALSVRTLRGDTMSLASLRGKVVLLNFWATWCPPCRAEMPGFQKVYQEYHDRGLVVLGLATDDGSPVPVSVYLVEHGITYPVAMSSIPTERMFGGINAIPTTFLIDRAGRVRYQVRGIFARPALDEAVKRLLAEPAS